MAINSRFERPVLVTGGAGFLGRPLVAALAAAGTSVIAAGRSACPAVFRGLENVQWIEWDLASAIEPPDVVRSAGMVFHLAARKEMAAGDDECTLVRSNEDATIRLARAVGTTATRIIYASSQMVYGDPGSLSVTEDAPLDGMSSSAYACSKLNAENWLRHLQRASGVPCIALRFCGFVEGGGNIDYILARALRNEPIELYSRGRVCRDYLSIVRGASAFIAAASAPAVSGFEIYNIGSGQAMSAVSIAEAIRDEVQSTSEILLLDRAAPRSDFVFDISRARRELGFEPGDLAMSVTAYARAAAASYRRGS